MALEPILQLVPVQFAGSGFYQLEQMIAGTGCISAGRQQFPGEVVENVSVPGEGIENEHLLLQGAI